MNNLLFFATKWLVSPGNFDKLSTLIVKLIDAQMPGAEKKELVEQFVLSELMDFKLKFGLGWTIALDLVIAVVRVKYELPRKVS